jgi:hypothetical protein
MGKNSIKHGKKTLNNQQKTCFYFDVGSPPLLPPADNWDLE